MKETRSRRWISLLLTAVMLLSLIPAAVMPAAAANKTEDSYHRILHLDCGRKYFTKDWIKALINEMEDAGYNQLQLAFGNDGLRFLLDDMSFTANGTTYSHKTVVSKVEAGNKAQNSSGDDRWLTQTEMDEIIAYANDKNIEIIPLLNLPGHANAILDIANDAYNASGSNNTLDVANSDKAVEFGYAIFQKYVNYFADKGCKYFNFGADEYANDASGTFSFSRLNSTQYAKFVKFINQLASYIEGKGMTPRAFNDGLYYNGQSASIDTNIQCCYWSSGWGSYPVAAASTISGKGHEMINTNGDFYYVLGKNDQFDSGYSYASNFNNSTFMSSTINSPVGSMFCIWCDYPNAETETEVAQKTRLVLRAMAARMQDQSINTISTEVVSGGFNEDGTINTTGGTTESETVTDSTTNVTVTAPGLTSVAVTAGTASESNGVVSKTYSITLNGGAYTGKATVKIPYDTAFNGYTTLYGMAGSDRFDVTVENGYFVCAVPHFSDVTLYGEGRAVSNDGKTINIEVGKTEIIDLTNYTGATGSQTTGDAYIATAKVETKTTEARPTSITKVTMSSDGTYTGVLSDGNSNYMVLSNAGEISNTNDPANATTFTVTRTTSGMFGSTSYTIFANEYYLTVESSGNWSSATYSLGTATSSTNWSYGETNGFSSSNRRIYWNGAEWTVARNISSDQAHLYTVTPAVPGESKSTLTFTGVGEGTTTATVGDTTYTINVTAPTNTETKTLNFGNTLNLPTGATDVKVTGSAVTYADGKITAGNEGGTATVTFVTKNAGGKVTARYTYTITVAAQDLSKVEPLTIEYWITNARPTGADGKTEYSVSASAPGVYSENGVDVSTFLPESATKESRTLGYWKTVKLEASNNNTATNNGHQTERAGDDETWNENTTVTRVRYWENNWQVLVGDQWKTVDQAKTNYTWSDNNGSHNVTKAKTQIVAYYMEILPVADELYVNAADWGKKTDGTTSGDYLPADTYCSVSIQVVYADGTTNPASTNAPELNRATIGYGYWDSGRGIGTLNLKGLENHQIWKIEAETGSITASFGNGNWGSMTATEFSWDNNPMTVFEDAENPVDSYTIHNDSNNPSDVGYYKNLQWDENKEAILIKVYVKAKATEDSLTVIYRDEKFNADLYSYNISVASGNTFANNIINSSGTTTAWNDVKAFASGSDRKDVTGYGIVNTLGVTQKFETNLTKVPEAVGKYNQELYTYTGSEISSDGKTLYLYYNINTNILKPNFVADFGLPIQFPLSDLTSTGQVVKSVTVKPTTNYGTLTYDSSKKVFTYTPTKVIPNYDVLTISILFDGESAVSTTNVGVTAASNVLYEDSFLKVNTEKDNNYAAWTTQPTQATNTQQAQKAGETANVFGYDTAYASSTGNSMNSAWSISGLTSGNASKYLTTSFYGNGFDLIGTAGPDTGYVYLLLQGPANKLVIIDTSYAPSTLSQVPLAHLEGLTEGTYTVNIRAAYRAATASTTSTASTYGMNSSDPMEDVYAVMEELYQDGFEIDDIEVVGVDEAAVASTLSAETATRATASAGTTVTIDGFRVYRSSNNESYPEAEKNVTYVNVLNATLDGESFTAYTESSTGTWTQNNYESSGGPQNEVYLANGNAIAFKVNANAKVQISARAVSGNAVMTVNGTPVDLKSNTEMYYEVTPVNGIVTISNTGDAMVALGNLKLSAGIATAALTAEDEPAVFALLRMTSAPAEPEGPETSVFTPEKLDINVKSLNVLRNKLVTLTITTSTDVASLTVNGKTLKPTNSWLVKKGWSDEYVYVLADKVKRNENKAYEVIAYNADGTASAAKTVNG